MINIKLWQEAEDGGTPYNETHSYEEHTYWTAEFIGVGFGKTIIDAIKDLALLLSLRYSFDKSTNNETINREDLSAVEDFLVDMGYDLEKLQNETWDVTIYE